MVITQPTVDDFSDTTVMRVIRKIVNYLCNDLIDGINDNDIVSGEFTINGDQLSGTLTKGDGTDINIPAITLPGGVTETNPYPTSFSATITEDGATMNFTLGLSNSTNVTGTCDLSVLASASDLLDIQEQISGLSLISSGNQMSINGTNAPIINSVEGSVSGNKLTIGVNGVNSKPIVFDKGISPTFKELTYISISALVSWMRTLNDGDIVQIVMKYQNIDIFGIKTTLTNGNIVIYGSGNCTINNNAGVGVVSFSLIGSTLYYSVHSDNTVTSYSISSSDISSSSNVVVRKLMEA